MNKNKQGQSLFELMMAVFITAVTLVALLSLVSTSVSNSTFSRDRGEAVKLTNEVTEWLRSERDADWSLLTSRASVAGTPYCVPRLNWDNQSSCKNTTNTDIIVGSKFVREITLYYDPLVDPNTVEASVVTTWSDSGGDHESRTVTRLTNWRSI